MKFLKNLVLAALVLAATYMIIYYIATIKLQLEFGSETHKLSIKNTEEMKKLETYLKILDNFGKTDESDQIRELARKGNIWLAKNIKGRIAMYVETVKIIRRIYIVEAALDSPGRYLREIHRVKMDDEDYMNAYSGLYVAGTLYHELLHYNGELSEEEVYKSEIEFYESVPQAQYYYSLDYGAQSAYNFAVDSAVLSAQKAFELEQEEKKN